MKLLIGLGNPGKKYHGTRHNIGFAIIDFVLDNWLKNEGFSSWSTQAKFQAEISEGRVNDEKIILAKSTTFMNNSGLATQALISFYKLEPKDLIVIHDDLDLPFGTHKTQFDRGSAGHNGVQSIIDAIGSQAFTRIRIGIGKENKQLQGNGADFVLNRFGLLEKVKMSGIKNRLVKELQTILQIK